MKREVIIEMDSADDIRLACEAKAVTVKAIKEEGEDTFFIVNDDAENIFDTLAEALEFAYAEVQKV